MTKSRRLLKKSRANRLSKKNLKRKRNRIPLSKTLLKKKMMR